MHKYYIDRRKYYFIYLAFEEGEVTKHSNFSRNFLIHISKTNYSKSESDDQERDRCIQKKKKKRIGNSNIYSNFDSKQAQRATEFDINNLRH